LDNALGTKKTQDDAKNYKKLLVAMEQYKLLHPKEIKALFSKANKFLNKESIQKEKAGVKKTIQEKVITEGVKVKEPKLDLNSEAAWEDCATNAEKEPTSTSVARKTKPAKLEKNKK